MHSTGVHYFPWEEDESTCTPGLLDTLLESRLSWLGGKRWEALEGSLLAELGLALLAKLGRILLLCKLGRVCV